MPVRAWARRTTELHDELAAIADVDPRWWLLAGTAAAAEPLPARADYVVSDADPNGDTFIGHRSPAPDDPVRDAIARAHAARAALRELDGQLPSQPLAVTVDRDAGARTIPSALDVAAFAIGRDVLHVRLAAAIEDEAELAAALARALRGDAGPPRTPPGAPPFACIALGGESIATARHGHRRAWRGAAGPWLGLGRADDLAVVSTCHLVLDGYGHAWLAARIASHHAALRARAPTAAASSPAPALAPVAGAIPLGVAWRELPSPAPRALPLAYALGRLLHRRIGRADARFSPTFQLPIAPGAQDDPERRRRRVVYATLSVRFDGGTPEPFEAFAARARDILAREARGRGLNARLLAAARAVPVSLAWKRRTFTAARPRWLDRIAEVVGGRACLSRIGIEAPVPPSCAVSSPARVASPSDPLGGCVLTVIDDGTRAAITACGSGLAGSARGAEAVLTELLALAPP